jgi:hypothetical protein
LLGLWITVSTGASIVLSGRAEAFVKLFVGLAMLFVAAPMVIRMAISPHAQGQFLQVAAAVLSVAILLGTAWAFVIARRRALIESSTVWIAASVWIVVSAAVIAELLRVSDRSLVGAVVVMGVGTLIVTPLATTPLAIVWNRNR